jgi:CubicO group peptidase (beta-lactamase class C family)
MLSPQLIASKPEEVGIDSENLEAVFARAKRDVDEGLLPSAQVAIARKGKLAGVRTFGSAVQGAEEKRATDETLYSIFSSTKAVVAVAVWLLFEEGQLKLEERVADIIPEFGTNGKDVVTVEQVLLHTGGFPYAPFRRECWGDREALLEAFQRWRLNWEPDSRYEYHPSSGHWVLSEIIYRRTGMDFRDFIRRHVTGPMGLNELFVGLPKEYDSRVADVRWVGEPVEPPGGWGEVTPEACASRGTARR